MTPLNLQSLPTDLNQVKNLIGERVAEVSFIEATISEAEILRDSVKQELEILQTHLLNEAFFSSPEEKSIVVENDEERGRVIRLVSRVPSKEVADEADQKPIGGQEETPSEK